MVYSSSSFLMQASHYIYYLFFLEPVRVHVSHVSSLLSNRSFSTSLEPVNQFILLSSNCLVVNLKHQENKHCCCSKSKLNPDTIYIKIS